MSQRLEAYGEGRERVFELTPPSLGQTLPRVLPLVWDAGAIVADLECRGTAGRSRGSSLSTRFRRHDSLASFRKRIAKPTHELGDMLSPETGLCHGEVTG